MSNRSSADIFIKKSLPRTTEVYDTYWQFAAERQRIFFKRLRNKEPPWTHDVILSNYRFTNCYRASDRVSQYLIRNVIYSGQWNAHDLCFRILLFKIFNKISTWEFLEGSLGEITWAGFRLEKYEKIINDLREQQSIYSGAYIMPSGTRSFRFAKKHLMHLSLLKLMFERGLTEKILAATTMQKAFEILREFPTVGDFLAYQFISDINYSELTNFSENEFTIPGPGARGGIKKCFSSLGDYSESEIIRWVAERQSSEFSRVGENFLSLYGRPLQFIDCQNIFCETDKYARVRHPLVRGRLGRTNIKQKFKMSKKEVAAPFYPPKWGLHVDEVPG